MATSSPARTLKASKEAIPDRWTTIREANGTGFSGERLRFWKSQVRNRVVQAGRQSLKTEMAAKRTPVLWLPTEKPWPDPRYGYTAPTQEQAINIVWNDYKRLVPESWIDYISESQHYIRTTWNAELWVFGSDKPERAEGRTWDGLIRDECANMKQGVWAEHYQPMMMARNGKSVHIGTPDRAGTSSADFKALCDYAKLSGDPEWDFFHWRSREVMPKEAIERMERELPPDIFDQEEGGLWVAVPGVAYYGFSQELHVKPTPFIPGRPAHVSCDFNRGHHNWIITQIEPNPNDPSREFVKVPRQLYLRNADVETMCNALRDILTTYSPEYARSSELLHFYGDGTGTSHTAKASFSEWEQIQRKFPKAGVHYRPNGPIATSLDLVNSYLKNAAGEVSIQVDKSCTELINDLEYVQTKELYSDQKTGRMTHSSDCLRYLLVQRKESAKLQGFNAAKIGSIFNI